MRVSPALLACFSLVAIAGLPSQAAESSEVANSNALETNVEANLVATLAATSEAAPIQSADQLTPIVEQRLALQTSTKQLVASAPLAEPPTLESLSAGATKQLDLQDPQPETPLPAPVGEEETAPVLTIPVPSETPAEEEPAEDEPAEAESAEDAPANETEADEAEDVLPEAEQAPSDTESPSGLPSTPTPAAPNNTAPDGTVPEGSAPDGTAPDGAVPSQPNGTGQPGIEADEASPNAPADPAAAEPAPAETQVLVSEVDVVSTNEQPLPAELVDAVYQAVGTVPGRTTTRSQLQEDINNVFETGYFSNVRADPEDTPLGVKVTFFVEPNPVLTRVDVRNREVLPDETVDEIFGEQYGKILNLRDFQSAVLDLNDWYQENGYVLAQVTAAPQIGDDGTVTLIVAEGEIESIEVRYITPDGEFTDEEGNPIGGRTRDFIVTREFETQPGDVFQQETIQEDIGRAFGLGIFEDIRLSLDPGDEDPRKVKLVVNIAERDTGSIGASLGFNLRGDLFGQLSYNQDNFGGNNQKLRTEARVTTRGDFLFDLSFTDPWIAGDPYRTSYTASLFNRRATSLIFDNGPIDVNLPNGDTPRLNRLGTGISFSRPLDNGLSLSLGAQYERVALLDGDSRVSPVDELGNQLTASSSGRDDLFVVQFGGVLDRRNNPLAPTSGSLIRLGTEQSVPIGNGSIFFNKIQGSYSQYVPVNFFNSEESRETIAFNVQGGTILGDLPPYEAFPIGGGNSVRGYREGAVGAGRSFLLGTVEYRFPLFSQFLNGAIFADYGTDLGSGDAVPGNPGGVRGKPGSGFGYGAGVRVQIPALGQLRLDYGLSDEGSRFHFGFGERF
jgi:outer membrane protein insertion porin family